MLERGLNQERSRDWTAAIETYHDAMSAGPAAPISAAVSTFARSISSSTAAIPTAAFATSSCDCHRNRPSISTTRCSSASRPAMSIQCRFEPLIRNGLDNLEVALRDPVFVKTNAPTATPDRVTWLRETLKRYRARWSFPTARRPSAWPCPAAKWPGRRSAWPSTPVLLEFTCGACDALDDFTSYLTPDKLEDLYAMIDGNFVGLGVELKIDKEGLRLVGVIRGGPAWEAGLKIGELIVAHRWPFDQGPQPGRSRQPASRRRRNRSRDPGARAATAQPRAISCSSPRRRRKRGERQAPEPADGIGYLQLTGFQKTSAEEIDRALGTLSGRACSILVLDLRGNPGGLLNVAVEIAERFIDQGLVVPLAAEPKGRPSRWLRAARPAGECPCMSWSTAIVPAPAKSWPVPFRITTAPPSSALRTYGKGSVQSIFSLRSAPAGLEAHHRQILFAPQSSLQRTGRAARHSHHRSLVRQTRRPVLRPPAKISHPATPSAISSWRPRSGRPKNGPGGAVINLFRPRDRSAAQSLSQTLCGRE